MNDRPRNTTRQREAGAASRAETRRRLEVAAAELFAEQGYNATTVNMIALRAGVSLQTLYLACGNKAQLLRIALEQALSGTPEGIDANYLPRLQTHLEAAGTGSGAKSAAEQVVRGFASVSRASAERAAPFWRAYRDGAAVDPEIAADWKDLTARRRATAAKLLAPLTGLRPDLPAEFIIDSAWTVASPEVCDLLVRQAGYTLDAYEHWITEMLLPLVHQQ